MSLYAVMFCRTATEVPFGRTKKSETKKDLENMFLEKMTCFLSIFSYSSICQK